MFESIKLYLIGGAIAAAAAFSGLACWHIQGWRMGAQIDELKTQAATAANTASERYRAREEAWAHLTEQVEIDHAKRLAASAADATAARAAAVGLRDDLSAALRRAAAGPAAGSGVADAGSAAVADVCVDMEAEGRAMAEAADKWADVAAGLRQQALNDRKN